MMWTYDSPPQASAPATTPALESREIKNGLPIQLHSAVNVDPRFVPGACRGYSLPSGA